MEMFLMNTGTQAVQIPYKGGVGIVVSTSPEDFAVFHRKEDARFAKVIKDANIQTE